MLGRLLGEPQQNDGGGPYPELNIDVGIRCIGWIRGSTGIGFPVALFLTGLI